ncbi:MAG: YjbQ family protein [Rhodospirillaceae bacterium]|nr:YjbQ family protein [Rhodospirillaceae bacterium]
MQAIVHCDHIEVALATGPDIVAIDDALARIVGASQVLNGSAHVTAVGSTASLTTIEFEPGAVADLKAAITRLAPPDARYAHEEAWHDGNGHSHVQAALLGPSIVLPVRGGTIALGTWQQVVLINHDNRPRRRRVEVTVIGDSR